MVKASKVAIVTGAGSGIGKAAALALLRDGWSVVLAGRRESLLQDVVGESEGGVRALAVPTDVDGGRVKRSVLFWSSEAVAEFERYWIELDRRHAVALTLSAVLSAGKPN